MRIKGPDLLAGYLLHKEKKKYIHRCKYNPCKQIHYGQKLHMFISIEAVQSQVIFFYVNIQYIVVVPFFLT